MSATSDALLQAASLPRRQSRQPVRTRGTCHTGISVISARRRRAAVRIKADMRYLMAVRLVTQGVAKHLRLDVGETYDLTLSVGEACANAIEHGSPRGARNEVAVSFSWTDDELRVQIEDQGQGCRSGGGFERRAADRGFGIHLMRSLMDRVSFVRTMNGTKVVMTKRLRK